MTMFKVVDLPEENAKKRGYHHGEELREDIQELYDAWRSHTIETSKLHLPEFLREKIKPLTGWFADSFYIRGILIKKFRPFISPELKTEMKAISEAANVPREFVELENCFDDLFRIYLQPKNLYLQQCSGFAFKDENKNTLIALNQDYGVLQKQIKKTRIFRYTSDFGGQTPFMSVAFAGYAGVFRGMNKRGVALGYFTSHAKDATMPGKPIGLWLRNILSSPVANFSLITNEIEYGPRTIGTNILICDKKEVRIYETSRTRFSVRTESPLIVTNHPLSKKMLQFYCPETWMHGSESSPEVLSPEYSRKRFARIKALFMEKAPRNPEEARIILADPGVCNYTTLRTTIFDPTNLTIWSAVIEDGGDPPVARGKLVPVSFPEKKRKQWED